MAYANSKNQTGFVQKESAFGTIPNSGGTATVANGDAFRSIALEVNADQGVIPRPDKNPSLSAPIGIGGKKSGDWKMRCSLAGSGAAGTVPDIDAFLEAWGGAAGVIVASTSVTYNLDDVSPSLSIFSFRSPATVTQQIAHGATVARARFVLGEDVATVEMSGPARWVLDDDQFATADATAKGGLTSFPSAPGSPTFNGNMAVGFTGVVTLDGQSYGTLRTATIDCNMNRDIPLDVFNNYYGVEPGQDLREIIVEMSMYDDDSANLSALKVKAINKTAVDLVYQVGTVAGNIWTLTLKNVLLAAPKYDDSQRRYSINFTGRAHATTGTSKDEIKLVLT